MLGERLAGLRKQKGLTQKQLALHLHLSVGTIAMYETEKRKLDMDKINLFCDFFNVSSDYLIGRTSRPSALQSEKEQPTLPTDQQELLQLYVLLSDQNQGRLLERARILAEDEIVIKKSANNNVG